MSGEKLEAKGTFGKSNIKTLLHPIFEKFRKEYAVPHSLIVDDYEREIVEVAEGTVKEKDAEIENLKVFSVTSVGKDVPNIFVWQGTDEGPERKLVAKVWLYPSGQVVARTFPEDPAKVMMTSYPILEGLRRKLCELFSQFPKKRRIRSSQWDYEEYNVIDIDEWLNELESLVAPETKETKP